MVHLWIYGLSMDLHVGCIQGSMIYPWIYRQSKDRRSIDECTVHRWIYCPSIQGSIFYDLSVDLWPSRYPWTIDISTGHPCIHGPSMDPWCIHGAICTCILHPWIYGPFKNLLSIHGSMAHSWICGRSMDLWRMHGYMFQAWIYCPTMDLSSIHRLFLRPWIYCPTMV